MPMFCKWFFSLDFMTKMYELVISPVRELMSTVG